MPSSKKGCPTTRDDRHHHAGPDLCNVVHEPWRPAAPHRPRPPRLIPRSPHGRAASLSFPLSLSLVITLASHFKKCCRSILYLNFMRRIHISWGAETASRKSGVLSRRQYLHRGSAADSGAGPRRAAPPPWGGKGFLKDHNKKMRKEKRNEAGFVVGEPPFGHESQRCLALFCLTRPRPEPMRPSWLPARLTLGTGARRTLRRLLVNA